MAQETTSPEPPLKAVRFLWSWRLMKSGRLVPILLHGNGMHFGGW